MVGPKGLFTSKLTFPLCAAYLHEECNMGGVLMYIAALEMPPQHADCGFIFYGSLQHGMWLWNTRLLELA